MSQFRKTLIQFEFRAWAYVLMPSHVHLLVRPSAIQHSTAKFLHYLKFPVGFHGLKLLRDSEWKIPNFWKAGPGFDENVTDVGVATEIVRYIHNNPVRRGLVDSTTDWRWSSARFWAGHEEFDLAMDEIV